MALHAEHDLLQAYLDGELPAEECRALEERLKVEPALAEALIELSREDAILCEWVSSTQAAEEAVQAEAALVVSASPARRWRGRRMRAAVFAAVAVAAAAAA